MGQLQISNFSSKRAREASTLSTNILPPRPGKKWMGQAWARVAFIAHALMPEYLSTTLIKERLTEVGREWPGSGEDPGAIRWLSFPVVPPRGVGLRPIWVDFYIIPQLALSEFYPAVLDGRAWGWVKATALAAIAEAQQDGVEITLGWGALTKNATDHGAKFLAEHPELVSKFHSTHGDAGTAIFEVEGMRRAGIHRGCRVAVLGANGAIGDVTARVLIDELRPESILLVGKPDKPGETKKLEALAELARRVVRLVPDGQKTEVLFAQNQDAPCRKHESTAVVVAVGGEIMKMDPSEVLPGTMIFDMTTPAACRPDSDWQGRLVLTAGCGQFAQQILPFGFGKINEKRIDDLGAGGPRVIWGCTAETIARAATGRSGHLAGKPLPLESLSSAREDFRALGVEPQPPCSFGQPMSWKEVRSFASAAEGKRRSSTFPWLPATKGAGRHQPAHR